jgi:DNA-binding NtrC family response regulator
MGAAAKTGGDFISLATAIRPGFPPRGFRDMLMPRMEDALNNPDIATRLSGTFHILVVDDESGIVNAVRREIAGSRSGGQYYEVEAFTDPVAALERARTREFHAVLADYRMPGMDGIAFLKALRALQPDCARIVLSGQTDMDALVRMINETHIFRFIAKPWSSEFLDSSLAQALAFRAANIENRRLALERGRPDTVPNDVPATVERVIVVDRDARAARNVMECLAQHSRFDDLYAEAVMEFQATRTDENLSEIDVRVADPRQALEMAASGDVSCLIADCRFDGMDAREFFARFVGRQPDCAIILLSAEPNLREIAFSIPRLFTFLIKPWNDFELRSAVAQALAHRRIELENRALAGD